MCNTKENIFTAKEKRHSGIESCILKNTGLAFTPSDVNVKAPIDFSGNMIVSNG